MDISEQKLKFQEFIEKHYYAELLENVNLDNNFIVLDFIELSRFDPEIADHLLEEPEEVIKAAELAVKDFDLPKQVTKFFVRFKNLPKSQEMPLRDIRSKHLGKFFFSEGIVRQKSDVRPQVTIARFECPSCGAIIPIPQIEQKFKEPSRCSCGRKGKFTLISKELVDAQKLVLEESPDQLDGGDQPKRMNVFLKNDLVSPLTDKKTNPGTKIRVVGSVMEVPIPSKDGGKLTTYDLMIYANYVEPMEEDFGQINISPEEEEEIIKLSKDPEILKKLVESMAPSIYGHDKIKEAILMQLLGGCRKKRSDGAVTRGDMHVLLIGDPGAGKSQLIKRAQIVAPKSRYVSGKGASGAGLTAAVVKDDFTKGWSLEAGALVLANRGFCMIDELDKMSHEDRSAMHEALEQQTVTISKANIQATLRCETSVLAAANPKFGRFDPYKNIAEQIDLPPPLISRFDLIFPVRDVPDVESDERLASFLLKLHKTNDIKKTPIESKILTKYVSYARNHCVPKLTDEALKELKNYYVKIRNSGGKDGRSVPITARQLEALVRLSEAFAKTSLSETVTKENALKAIELLHYCMSQIGVDPETGNIDMDIITTGVSSSTRSTIMSVKDIISELEEKLGKSIPIEDIINSAKEKKISADKIDEIIERLKRSGDIFTPKPGIIQRL